MVDSVSYEEVIAPIYNYLETQELPEGTTLSFPLPCIYNQKLLDMFFTYRHLKSHDKETIEVDELLIVNPYEKSLIARFESNYHIETVDIINSDLTYEKYLRLRNKYTLLYEKIRPFAFETSITTEQQKLLSTYLQIFSQMFETHISEIYCNIGEVFFKWIILASGGGKQ